MLAPIIQAAQLLQARKSDEDVFNVCEMCSKMSISQVSGSQLTTEKGNSGLTVQFIKYIYLNSTIRG